MRRRIVLGLLIVMTAGGALAHPLPNTVITLSVVDGGLRLRVVLPVHELQLALPQNLPKDATQLLTRQDAALRDYFNVHLAVLSAERIRQRHVITGMALADAVHEDVGTYQVLKLEIVVAAADGFDPADFILDYDAIMHHVPNHTAMMRWDGSPAIDVGVLAYDFVVKKVKPMRIWRN